MKALAPLSLLIVLVGQPIHARRSGPGPGRPIAPPLGARDETLHRKARALQQQMWRHISPEGLLVYTHTRSASPARLSHEAIHLSDVAIWTGCYAAAQACRWHATRDPHALHEARRLAHGLRHLTLVTGVPGRLARNLGMPQPGLPARFEPPVIFSPTGTGFHFRTDVSRDQLAGVVLGWALLGRYVQDAEVQALAKEQSAALARRLWADGMWLRDCHGNKTEFGELRADVEGLPLLKNGPLAAVGLAPFLVAADLNPAAPDLQDFVRRLDRQGWDNALPSQITWLSGLVNNSNVNMTTLALLSVASSSRSKEAGRAREGMAALRQATIGWWNAGIAACFLLGGLGRERSGLIAEIRATLHRLPGREVPRTLVRQFHGSTIAPIDQRQPSSWHWTNDVSWTHHWRIGGRLGQEVRYTGADYLFAYWLARAARAFDPPPSDLAGPWPPKRAPESKPRPSAPGR